jgi:hypothetical protein
MSAVTVGQLLEGHVLLEVECLDRIYLNGYVPTPVVVALRPVREFAVECPSHYLSAGIEPHSQAQSIGENPASCASASAIARVTTASPAPSLAGSLDVSESCAVMSWLAAPQATWAAPVEEPLAGMVQVIGRTHVRVFAGPVRESVR